MSSESGTTPKVYEKGAMVVMKDGCPSKKTAGDEPLEVVKVMNAVECCTCRPHPIFGHSPEVCISQNAHEVGHAQMIWVEVDGEEVMISGYWFVLA